MFATISEWHDEAGGGKTFCLSVFLEVLELGSFSTCHALHPPASIRYATFYAPFYATQKSEPFWRRRNAKRIRTCGGQREQWVDST